MSIEHAGLKTGQAAPRNRQGNEVGRAVPRRAAEKPNAARFSKLQQDFAPSANLFGALGPARPTLFRLRPPQILP
jgi:hypothetical protein